ncbi:MAG: hypothetical protein O7J95_02925 [Planctomycetota bacterium]|nr:hypothetical protein [Planctomycetota bacterium]
MCRILLVVALLLAPTTDSGEPEKARRKPPESGASVQLQALAGADPAGEQVLTAGGSAPGGGTIVYVLDPRKQEFLAYSTGRSGVRLRGVRTISWDLLPDEVQPGERRLSVSDLKKAAPDADPSQIERRFLLESASTRDGKSWAFVLDAAQRVLAVYAVDAQGVRLAGSRHLRWDLVPQEIEPGGRRFSVEEMKRRSEGLPAARAADALLLAAGPTPTGRPVAYVLDPRRGKLVCYSLGRGGIELRGVRTVGWDLLPDSVDPRGRRLTTAEMKKRADGRGPVVSKLWRLVVARTVGGGAEVHLIDAEHGKLAAYTVDSRGIRLNGVQTFERR